VQHVRVSTLVARMTRQLLRGSVAVLAAAIALTAAASAARVPPLPRAAGHRTVTVVARGVPTPTEFAVLAGHVFVGGYGDETDTSVPGGVYLLRGGKAIRVPGSPQHVYGLAASKDALYLSTSQSLIAWSGWDGSRFRRRRVIRTPFGYGTFRGPAVGPDGLIYVGANTDPPPPKPNESDSFVSVNPATGETRIIATGIRQPWQPVFLPGHALPLVSDLNQDDLGPKRPLDYLLAITPGANYGFPTCPAAPRTCANYTQPLVRFPAHSSPMGLGYLNGKVYIAFYGGLGHGPVVVSMPPGGGRLTPVISGFPAPVIALGTARGSIYAGVQSGVIYRVTP
jgi:glucose/arabinose dehydrogenase